MATTAPTAPTNNDTQAGDARPLRTVAGLPTDHAADAIEHLEGPLAGLLDLGLTLKHAHWNVTGPNFIAVHEMLDQLVADVSAATDRTAERIRVLGGVPNGLAGHIAATRDWEEYPVGEASAEHHLRTLDELYEFVALDHRRAHAHMANADPVTEDLVIETLRMLEKHQWFIRSFLRGPQIDGGAQAFGSNNAEPTDREIDLADRHTDAGDGVEENYRHMTRLGAEVKGEGEI